MNNFRNNRKSKVKTALMVPYSHTDFFWFLGCFLIFQFQGYDSFIKLFMLLEKVKAVVKFFSDQMWSLLFGLIGLSFLLEITEFTCHLLKQNSWMYLFVLRHFLASLLAISKCNFTLCSSILHLQSEFMMPC